MSIHPSLQLFQQKINVKYLSNIKNEAFLNIDNPVRLNKLTGLCCASQGLHFQHIFSL
jgi:hypothetical protein